MSLIFTQDFSSDVGFTYNSALAEFNAGILRTKDQRPIDATCGATYTNDINLNWGNGSLTGTGTGGPTIDSGRLNLTGGTKSVRYSATGNANFSQTGCIRILYTPNYSGSPIGTRTIFSICKSIGSVANLIILFHNTARNLILSIYATSGSPLVNNVNLGTWSQVQSSEYEFELNINITTGATRLFINGTQFGSTQTATGVRDTSSAYFFVGADYNNSNFADAYYNNIILFSTVQHTTNYIPGAIVPETIYAESTITLPQFHYVGSENIVKYLSLAITEVNTPHYIIDDQYWTGAAWAASDNSYAQSNVLSDINSNLSSKTVNDDPIVKIVFPDGNTLTSVDDLIFTYSLLLSLTGDLIDKSEIISLLNLYLRLSGESETISEIISTLLIVLYYKGIIAELK